MANNLRRCELRPMSLNDKEHESPPNLNLTQLAEHEEPV
jgi:hypothetical protein